MSKDIKATQEKPAVAKTQPKVSTVENVDAKKETIEVPEAKENVSTTENLEVKKETIEVPEVKENVSITENSEAKKETIEVPETKENVSTTEDTETSRVMGIKLITDEEEEEEIVEAVALEPLKFISANGTEYQITIPKFRFKGQEYDSQNAIDKHPDVLEVLIDVNSFFIKKV